MQRAAFFVGLVLVGSPSVGGAQSLLEDPVRRREVVPSVRAATSCVTREAGSDPMVARAYALSGSIMAQLSGPFQRCSREIGYMISEHDRVYGYGYGQVFFEGAYRNDIERAVLSRIRPDLDRQKGEIERAEAERREQERQAEARRTADARRAEVERQETELRRQRAAAERVEQTERTRDLLRDHMYECTTRQLVSLVRSGEAAKVLANAAMTLCSSDVDAFLTYVNVKGGQGPLSVADQNTLRQAGREKILENVTASAVQVKAGANGSSGG